MRNMKISTLEELIHLSIWIRNDAIMNEEDDEAEGSTRGLPTKQIKISIQLPFHDIVLLCICLYLVNVLCMIECLHYVRWNISPPVDSKVFHWSEWFRSRTNRG